MQVKVVKINEAVFTGEDGKPVAGQYFYVKDFGGLIRRIFLTAERCLALATFPKVGDSVYLVENAVGKVVDILSADEI